jgi:hypothetical protein
MLVNNMQSLNGVMNLGEWLLRLDTSNWLLGFDDTVCDFKEEHFRYGVPTDIVTISTGHNSQNVLQRDPAVLQEILTSINDMHEFDDVREYVINSSATSVLEHRPQDSFTTWTGTGANGKTSQRSSPRLPLADTFTIPMPGITHPYCAVSCILALA